MFDINNFKQYFKKNLKFMLCHMLEIIFKQIFINKLFFLGMNIFVAFFLLLLLLADSTPQASYSVPYIGM